MINLKEIRNQIISELHKYMGILPVPQDQSTKKPSYPFITYKFISPYIPDKHQGNLSRELVESNDERFEYDIEESLTTQPQMTLSLNAYCRGQGDDQIIAFETAKKMADWFIHVGYQILSDLNVVVVNTAAFGDRTVLIVADHEVRYGFDVIMRTTDTISRRVETIEEWDMEVSIDE